MGGGGNEGRGFAFEHAPEDWHGKDRQLGGPDRACDPSSSRSPTEQQLVTPRPMAVWQPSNMISTRSKWTGRLAGGVIPSNRALHALSSWEAHVISQERLLRIQPCFAFFSGQAVGLQARRKRGEWLNLDHENLMESPLQLWPPYLKVLWVHIR